MVSSCRMAMSYITEMSLTVIYTPSENEKNMFKMSKYHSWNHCPVSGFSRCRLEYTTRSEKLKTLLRNSALYNMLPSSDSGDLCIEFSYVLRRERFDLLVCSNLNSTAHFYPSSRFVF